MITGMHVTLECVNTETLGVKQKEHLNKLEQCKLFYSLGVNRKTLILWLCENQDTLCAKKPAPGCYNSNIFLTITKDISPYFT